MIDRLKSFHDFLYGGAWPFLVRGLICLVDSDNVRDLNILFRLSLMGNHLMFLRKPTLALLRCFLMGPRYVLNISTGKFKAITGLGCP